MRALLFALALVATPVRGMFANAIASYARVGWLRFGPLSVDNRVEKILLWPDPRGIALKQVQAALVGQDPTVTDPALLPNKSVALRGFVALECLLFGTGAEALTTGDAFRCASAHSVATVIAAGCSRVRRVVGDGGRINRRAPDRCHRLRVSIVAIDADAARPVATLVVDNGCGSRRMRAGSLPRAGTGDHGLCRVGRRRAPVRLPIRQSLAEVQVG